MDRKRLNLIFICAAAGIIALVALIAMLRTTRPADDDGAPVVINAEVAEAEIVTIHVSPSPSPEPERYENTVSLLVDRQPILTLSSEYEAKTLLWEYLNACAVPPAGERLVSARFDCELILAPAEETDEPMPYADALALLLNVPSAVPVRMETQRVTYESSTVETSEESDSTIPKGSRVFTQLGAGALTQTLTEVTYRAGETVNVGASAQKTIHEARSTIVRVGSYKVKDPNDEPDKDEGPTGKDKGALKFAYPMRGSVSSYFGFRNGNMHSGLDISAKEGTSVVAPGEGVVVYCGERGAYGLVVDIDHGNGFLSRLTHLDNVQVELNQRVFLGDAVGSLAVAEDEKKPHLHYELIVDGVPFNPLHYIR